MNAENNLLRLKSMLLKDKSIPQGLLDVFSSDLESVISDYFDFNPEKLNLSAAINQDGKYILKIELLADRIKSIKTL